ncbi:hypothetical protein FO440_19925 [Mucilaginibacter corticis]|uniref:Uncharacterized protein n=1 Tax=Mucilaginibacter corticis TaxID=2597670 RepID=A0A556MG66_9SPHI|nr:hypothetical protein [Mucilaginibacter corticis]TSJ38775.1 hypothetical protein FO440_19925 [Mucilaginibacter corticis]
MANHPVKYNTTQNRAGTWKHNWEVMKPFVHFGFKAIALIGGTLISIIKLLPMLAPHKEEAQKKETRIIRI